MLVLRPVDRLIDARAVHAEHIGDIRDTDVRLADLKHDLV
jgi:hypothetical protein